MGDVIQLDCITTQPTSPDSVLEGAKGKLTHVLVLGWQEDGEFWASSSDSDMKLAVYAASKFIHKEMNGDYSGE